LKWLNTDGFGTAAIMQPEVFETRAADADKAKK